MAKFKITHEFRSHLSEKLMDLGNLVGAALVFGQFVSSREFSLLLLMVGIILMGLCYVGSFLVSL